MKKTFFFIVINILIINVFSQDPKYNLLLEALGEFPDPPIIKIDTLEKTRLENGMRYKIEYLVEYSDSIFNEPEDRVKAYLFVPYCNKTEKLPAIVAIHQDANNTHIGKSEPAGFETSDSYPDQKYGLELFNRGYIVICPDRFGHAERRRIPSNDTINVNRERDGELYNHRVGQLLLKGRSKAHVDETEKMIIHAKIMYKKYNAEDNIQALYFDGGHFFPAAVKNHSYLFIDKYLSPDKYIVNKSIYDKYKSLVDYFSVDTNFCNIYFPKAKRDHLEYLLCSYNLDEYHHTIADLQSQKKKTKKPIEFTYSNFEFKIYAPDAKNVLIRGSFNNWKNEELVKQDNGYWVITKRLRKGIYTFGYFVDDTFSLAQNCETYYGAIGEKLSIIEIK